MIDNKKIHLFDDPNRWAGEATFSVENDNVKIGGYQKYIITKNDIQSIDDNTTSNYKFEMLLPHIKDVMNKSVLDLGCANGMHMFLSLYSGASEVVGVDMDPNYCDVVQKVIDHYNFDNVNIINDNVVNYDKKSDVVIALALVHWIYSCTSFFGSMDKTVKWLRDRTNDTLIVEWTDPDDVAIQFLNHTEFNKEYLEEEYSEDNFLKALNKYFDDINFICEYRSTRRIYICK
jgi:cyclopropane fatty-acyl-phospholipid synthase-like methyltransferase